MKKEFFHHLSETLNSVIFSFVFQGIILIALAVLIIFYPQILVALIAVLMAVIGIVVLLVGFKIWGFKKRYKKYLDFIEKL